MKPNLSITVPRRNATDLSLPCPTHDSTNTKNDDLFSEFLTPPDLEEFFTPRDLLPVDDNDDNNGRGGNDDVNGRGGHDDNNDNSFSHICALHDLLHADGNDGHNGSGGNDDLNGSGGDDDNNNNSFSHICPLYDLLPVDHCRAYDNMFNPTQLVALLRHCAQLTLLHHSERCKRQINEIHRLYLATGLPLPCPKCESSNTDFCNYIDASVDRSRHLCKRCHRHWTRDSYVTQDSSAYDVRFGAAARKYSMDDGGPEDDNIGGDGGSHGGGGGGDDDNDSGGRDDDNDGGSDGRGNEKKDDSNNSNDDNSNNGNNDDEGGGSSGNMKRKQLRGLFGFKFRYHGGYEYEYPVELQCIKISGLNIPSGHTLAAAAA